MRVHFPKKRRHTHLNKHRRCNYFSLYNFTGVVNWNMTVLWTPKWLHIIALFLNHTLYISCVWNCLWGNALKRSCGMIRKSRVSYPGPGFLSSATWPSLPKKHYNRFNKTKPNRWDHLVLDFYIECTCECLKGPHAIYYSPYYSSLIDHPIGQRMGIC